MNKKIIIALVVVIAVVGIGIYFLRGKETAKPLAVKSRPISNITYPAPCRNPKIYKTLKEAEALGNPQKVCHLDLSRSDITELSPEIAKFVNLEDLNLSGNKLSKLPPELFVLTNLRMLYLDENALTEIPPQIGELVRLHMLSIFFNKLTTLPNEIAKLADLEMLGLVGNKIAEKEQSAIKNLLPYAQIMF